MPSDHSIQPTDEPVTPLARQVSEEDQRKGWQAARRPSELALANAAQTPEPLGIYQKIALFKEHSAMPTLEKSIVIEAPTHEVFKYAADWRYWPDWYDGFTHVSPITEVERGDGAIYAYKMWVLGVPFKAQTEVHNFVENKGWSGRRISGVPHKTTYIFENLDRHTKFTTIIYYSLPIPILGPVLCSLFFNRAWRRILEKTVNNLKAHFQC